VKLRDELGRGGSYRTKEGGDVGGVGGGGGVALGGGCGGGRRRGGLSGRMLGGRRWRR
jgi:hypothetical protein